MTITVKQEYPLRPSGSGLTNNPGQTPGSSFGTALAEALMKGRTGSQMQGRNEPLSQPEIAALMLNLQQQMNDQLFRSLAGDDSRGNRTPEWTETLAAAIESPAFLPPAVTVAAAKAPEDQISTGQASKNQRLPQKYDGFSSAAGLEQIIGQAAEAYGVEASLIRSVIKAESNFEPRSTSPRGAMGLMQLMPDTARELGVRDAYDPRENIMGGTKYLKTLLDRYGSDTRLALAAYNWGMGNVEKYPDKLPRETRDYIARVTRYSQGAQV